MVWAPPAWVTAVMELCREPIRPRPCWDALEVQVALIVAFNSSVLLGLMALIFHTTTVHRSSLGIRDTRRFLNLIFWRCGQVLENLLVGSCAGLGFDQTRRTRRCTCWCHLLKSSGFISSFQKTFFANVHFAGIQFQHFWCAFNRGKISSGLLDCYFFMHLKFVITFPHSGRLEQP